MLFVICMFQDEEGSQKPSKVWEMRNFYYLNCCGLGLCLSSRNGGFIICSFWNKFFGA